MEQDIVPFQISKGMVITGMYRGEQDDGHYVWLRRFDSEAAGNPLRSGASKRLLEDRGYPASRPTPRPGSHQGPAYRAYTQFDRPVNLLSLNRLFLHLLPLQLR